MRANYKITPEQYARERDAALLSLDKATIQAHAKKYGLRLPASEHAFWAGVHKAITAISPLHIERWLQSAEWLQANGYTVLCDRWDEAQKIIAAKRQKEAQNDTQRID